MSKVQCVFCGTTGNRAKEHLWPVWLQQFLEGGSSLRSETHRTVSGDTVTQRRLQNHSLVLGQVCEVCNGGWMSKLEQRASPIIKGLLGNADLEGSTITRGDADVLAMWGFKTAIVRNLGTNYRKIVPETHYTALFQGVIPNGVFVDLAIDPTHRTLGAVQSQTASGMLAVGDEIAFGSSKAHFYNIVLGVGPLFIRVVHFPLPNYEIRTALAHGRMAFRLHPNPVDGQLAHLNAVDGLYDMETATFFQPLDSEGAA